MYHTRVQKSTRFSLLLLVALLCILIALFSFSAKTPRQSGGLSVSFLNVGQGDAIFIESPTGVQVLIDAGGGREVLRALSRVQSWFDRSVDVIIATHPDQDHIGGFPDLLARYSVSQIFYSSVDDDGSDARAFARAVSGEVQSGAVEKTAKRGDMIDIGGGAKLEVLFPDRDVSGIETNTGSIVARLTYGDTTFLFTGDSPSSIEKYLVRLDGAKLHAAVLKVGHHGSRTSSSEEFIDAVSPSFAVISRGCDNSYGHPHKEVVERLAAHAIQILDTCTEGTITFVSDGVDVLMR